MCKKHLVAETLIQMPDQQTPCCYRICQSLILWLQLASVLPSGLIATL
jgi:hypothetical protein